MMRWFSVNECWSTRKREFWALKMLLNFHSGEEAGPQAEYDARDPAEAMHRDPRKELAALKSSTGGFKLAARLLTPWLRKHMEIYCAGTKSSWDWYTEQTTTVKSPADGIRHSIACGNGGWQKELQGLVAVLYDHGLLTSCGLSPFRDIAVVDQSHEATVLLDFTLRLCGNRCFANAVHDVPPLCYAAALSSDAAVREVAMGRMKTDWAMVTSLEHAGARNESSSTALADVSDILSPPVRLMFICYERDKWNSRSLAGRRVLRAMVGGLPDTKVVEDTHQHLRDLQRRGRSLVSSKVARSRACVFSGVLEQRSVPHRTVEKRDFLAGWKKKHTRTDNVFLSRRHKLGAEWSSLMEPRDWVSTTAESSRKSLACWDWMRTWWKLSIASHCCVLELNVCFSRISNLLWVAMCLLQTFAYIES